MRLLLSLLLLIGGSVFAGSVQIMNDTIYALTAEIIAADGGQKGKIVVQPQTTTTWQDAPGGQYSWSQTPYRVNFTCTKSGKQYGVVDGVQQAGMVRASTASGPRDCREDKKKNGQDQQQGEQQSADPEWGPPQGSTHPSPGGSQGQNQQQQSPQNTEPPEDPIWGPP